MDNKKEKMNSFSVALGLFDYINPIFYTVTSFTVLKNMNGLMGRPLFVLYTVGAILSLIFGFTIPTVKLIVGLGIMEFKMPVNLVFYVNSGILLSGMALFAHSFSLSTEVFIVLLAVILLLLYAIYRKSGKFNTVAVLIGAAGYLMIYISLIKVACLCDRILSVILYCLAICLFVFLILVGVKSDLKLPKVHWAIEIANVLCQFSVALSTVLLFLN